MDHIIQNRILPTPVRQVTAMTIVTNDRLLIIRISNDKTAPSLFVTPYEFRHYLQQIHDRKGGSANPTINTFFRGSIMR